MNDRVLDVEQDDLLTGAAVLHRLALALLEDLFDQGTGVTHEHWYGAADVRVFDRMPAIRLGWRRFLARFPPLRAAVMGKGRWLGLGAAKPRQMRWSTSAIRAHLSFDYHGVAGMRIPDRLLDLVGHTAWDAPEFRLHAATLVTEHFRNRLIISATSLSTPRLAAAVVWMVIATSRVAMPLTARLGLAYRPERRALERLQQYARGALEQMSMPNDFWSHWIAWHVERRFGAASELPPEWLSPLRFVESSFGRPVELLPWASPQALTAAYAAWYPTEKERGRVRPQQGS
jgi:hypothetical protein